MLRARGDTHMGKSDFSEGSIIILHLYFLHERTNNKVSVSAWNKGNQWEKSFMKRKQPELGRVKSSWLGEDLPPDIRAVGLWATVRTSWVWCWNGLVRTHCFSLLLEVTETSWKWNTVPSAVPTTKLSSCWEIKWGGRCQHNRVQMEKYSFRISIWAAQGRQTHVLN